MKRIVCGVALMMALAGCAVPATSTPLPATSTVTPVPTLMPSPMATATAVATNTPQHTPTANPTATSTIVPTLTRTLIPATSTPTVRPSATATATASATPGVEQACANLAAQGPRGILVVDMDPSPPLAWDAQPHDLRARLCSTAPAPAMPQGQYKIFLYFPESGQGREQTAPVSVELRPGLNQVSLGIWRPGLENHLANCVRKAQAEIEITYNDNPDAIFRPLTWSDGKSRGILPVQCGGNYP